MDCLALADDCWADGVENMGEWKFSRTPTVSWASAQISSARLCMSNKSVLVKSESKDS